MTRLKLIILILPILLLVNCAKESRKVNNKNDYKIIVQPDNGYNKFIGKWYSSEYSNSYDETFTKGGYVLEIIEINNGFINGYTASISMPPSNRIAGFDFEGKLTENKLIVDFTDGFDNKGEATITVLKDKIEIKINDFEISDDNSSGWGYNGDVFFEIKK